MPQTGHLSRSDGLKYALTPATAAVWRKRLDAIAMIVIAEKWIKICVLRCGLEFTFFAICMGYMLEDLA